MSRVTIDYTAGAQQGAGIGRYTRELVQALGRLDTTTPYTLLVRGDIRVAVSVDGFPANFHLRRIPIANRTFLRLWRAGVPLAGEWLAGAADVYYSPDFTLPPLRGGRAAVTIHDLSFLRTPEAADPRLRAYLSAAVPRAVARADHVFADSAHTRQDLIDLLGVAPDKISVLLSAASPHFRRVEDAAALAEVRARHGLDAPFILGLGTLEPRKNLARLMDAFARLRADGYPHRLILVGGRGWLDDPIFAHVERLGLRDRVRFLGYVPDADLPALYTLADAFAFPSLYEGFGLPPGGPGLRHADRRGRHILVAGGRRRRCPARPAHRRGRPGRRPAPPPRRRGAAGTAARRRPRAGGQLLLGPRRPPAARQPAAPGRLTG